MANTYYNFLNETMIGGEIEGDKVSRKQSGDKTILTFILTHKKSRYQQKDFVMPIMVKVRTSEKKAGALIKWLKPGNRFNFYGELSGGYTMQDGTIIPVMQATEWDILVSPNRGGQKSTQQEEKEEDVF